MKKKISVLLVATCLLVSTMSVVAYALRDPGDSEPVLSSRSVARCYVDPGDSEPVLR